MTVTALGGKVAVSGVDASTNARLRVLLQQCAQELFADYGVSTKEAAPTPREHDFAGVIGFTGAGGLRGTLFIASTDAFFASAAPGAVACDTGDWTAELANQLLGRLKNQLLRRGIEIFVATPVAVRGLRLSCTTEGPTLFVVLEGAAGAVVVGLETVSDKPLAWRDEDAAVAALDEGSLELF